MLIRKPDDDCTKVVPRSGHGAASVIPHLPSDFLYPRAGDDEEHEAAEVPERTAPTPTPPAGSDRKHLP